MQVKAAHQALRLQPLVWPTASCNIDYGFASIHNRRLRPRSVFMLPVRPPARIERLREHTDLTQRRQAAKPSIEPFAS